MHNDPHGARIDVRNATYANRLAEETEIQRVDDIIWDRVAVLEESTVANARVTIGKQTEQIESAETLATESRHLRYALEEGSITPTEARRELPATAESGRQDAGHPRAPGRGQRGTRGQRERPVRPLPAHHGEAPDAPTQHQHQRRPRLVRQRQSPHTADVWCGAPGPLNRKKKCLESNSFYATGCGHRC